MNAAMLVFWASWLILAYHLIGYGLLLSVLNRFKKAKPLKQVTGSPSVIVLCAAYNEEKVIEEKILSFLALDYPKDKIRLLIVSDDSTDSTNEIVSKYRDHNVELIVQKPRRGKQSAHNLVLPKLDCDYVLSTDANSIFATDAVSLLVKRMLSDDRLGMVSGELRLICTGDKQSGEGLYWRYETLLKKLDSQFKSIICANGSLFLIKRALFTEIDLQSADDFERTLMVLKHGYYVAYEPRAIVTEEETQKASDEISRKIRIITQEWFAMFRHAGLLNPFRYPAISFLLISHKLIRWLFFVFVLTGLLSSLCLLNVTFYKVALAAQIVVYSLGIIGLLLQKHNVRVPLTGIAAYIVAMIYSSCVAFMNFVLKKRTFGLWKPIR